MTLLTSVIEPRTLTIPEWDLSDRLRKSRELTGLGQYDFAELTGISRASVVNYEAGRRTPKGLYLRAWAEACGVPVEWLETGKAPIREDEGPLCAPRDLNPEPADYGSALGDGFDSINLPSIPDTADALLTLIPERVR